MLFRSPWLFLHAVDDAFDATDAPGDPAGVEQADDNCAADDGDKIKFFHVYFSF